MAFYRITSFFANEHELLDFNKNGRYFEQAS
jgi:hypothetical protein